MRVWIAAILVVATSITAQAGVSSSYRVLSDDRYETRRVVAVELLERVLLPQLRQIADRLKVNDTKSYERTVINFYLPSMNLGDGSWATVSYTPDRHTTIHGITREEELALIEKVRTDKRDRIGSWLASSTAIAGEITLFRNAGKKYVEWSLRNGLKSTKEVSQTRTWRGRRFDIKAGSKTYFLINNKNELEIRDMKGLIATGELIQPNEKARLQTALMRSRSRLISTPEVVIQQTKTKSPDVAHSNNANAVYQRQARMNVKAPLPQTAEANAGESQLLVNPVVKKRVSRKTRKQRVLRRAKHNAQDVFMSNLMR